MRSIFGSANEKVKKYEGKPNRNGKKTSEIKIDVIHELLTNRILDVRLEHKDVPDQAFSDRMLKFIEPGDLIIRDLGYFVLSTLQAISQAGAYYVSRLLPNVKVFLHQDSRKPIDLKRFVTQKCKKAPCIDIEVFLGDLKVPARLVLYRAPIEVRRVRLKNAKARAQATGRVMSHGKMFTIHYSAFITNVPIEMLSAELVGTIYQLRWEIELIFKQWKSLLKMNILEGINPNRIECLIWGRLCMVLFMGLVSQELGQIAEWFGKELSLVKVIKYVLREGGFCKAIQENKIDNYMYEMAKDTPRMLCKDRRCRKTMRGRVVQGVGFYGVQALDVQRVA